MQHFGIYSPPYLNLFGGTCFSRKFGRISFLPTLIQSGNQLEHDYLYWEFHEKGGRQQLRKEIGRPFKYDVLKNLIARWNFIICRGYWGRKQCGRIPPRSGKWDASYFSRLHARIRMFLHFLPKPISQAIGLVCLVELEKGTNGLSPLFFVCLPCRYSELYVLGN